MSLLFGDFIFISQLNESITFAKFQIIHDKLVENQKIVYKLNCPISYVHNNQVN